MRQISPPFLLFNASSLIRWISPFPVVQYWLNIFERFICFFVLPHNGFRTFAAQANIYTDSVLNESELIND